MKIRPLVLRILMLVPTLTASVAEGQTTENFQTAAAGYQYEFPRDHGSHEEYRTEWWYYTGHLRSEHGEEFGFELTFFRVGIIPPQVQARATAWELKNLALAHFAITDIGRKRFRYYEKLNRATPFTAGARTGSLFVFNEGWRAETSADGSFRIRASAGKDAIDLHLRSIKPPAVHGTGGVSVKSEGSGFASHYYSLSRLEASGTITVDGRAQRCNGTAWMDHEFGSSMLRETQQGWDWFSVQLDNETELMLYLIRRTDGSPDTTSAGSLVMPDGSVIHLTRDRFQVTSRRRWRSPRSRAVYPIGWQIDIPSLKLRLALEETMQDQELVTSRSTGLTYWEGAVRAVGTFGGTPVRGVGYVEMTGYDRRFGEE